MFSTRQEIAEETEGLSTAEHSDSVKASSSQLRQDDDAPRRKPILSTETAEEKRPEEKTANDDGGTASGKMEKWFLEPPSEWTLESTTRLISEYGTCIIHAADAEETPIFWNAVERDRLDCAKILLDHAKSNGVPVTFTCRNGDVLSRAITNGSDTHVECVLDILKGKYGTVAETIELLDEHLSDLFSQFPKISHRFLNEDRFTMEYARFEAPKALFGRNGKTPIAMLNDLRPESWQAMDSTAAKRLWIQNSRYGERLSNPTGQHIKVVAKFSCIRPGKVYNIYRAHLDVDKVKGLHLGVTKFRELFKSMVFRVYIDHLFGALRTFFLLGVLLDVVVAAAFTSFAILYRHQDDTIAPGNRGIAIALITVLYFANVLEMFWSFFSALRITIVIINAVLFMHTHTTGHHTPFFATAASVGCILCWVAFLRSLRPFGRVGSFVPTMGHAMIDSHRFAMMGFLLMLGYSAAFTVLFHDRLAADVGDNFTTRPRAPGTLFHKRVGNFETDMLHSSRGFLTVWRAIPFNSFVYAGPIVLMSLLVSILTNTHERVRSEEKAEQAMYRLQALMDFAKLVGFVEAFYDAEPCGELCSSWIYNTLLRAMHEKYKEIGTVEDNRFHFLVPEDIEEESSDDEWHSRLIALEKTINSKEGENEKALGEMSRKTAEESLAMFNKMRKMEESVSEMKTLSTRMGNIEKSMGEMKAAVDQILQRLAKT